MKRISTYHFLRSLLLVAAIGAGLASCARQSAEPAPDKGDGQIHLTSQIASSPAGGSRAPVVDGSVKAVLKDICILRKDSTMMPTDFTSATSMLASRDMSGKITFDAPNATQLYDRLTNRNAYFIAFWPNPSLPGTSAIWAISGKRDILVAGPWDAGNYTTSRSSGMVFEHQLAQLEVVCRVASESAVEAADIRATWGAITKIEVVDTYSHVTYDFKTPQIKLHDKYKTTLPLLKPDYETAFASMEIPDAVSTDVVAAGMFAPQKGSIVVRVTTATMGAVNLEVVLSKGGQAVDFARGKRHRVTIDFEKTKLVVSPYADITDWETAYETDGEIELPSDVFAKPSEGILDMRYPELVKADKNGGIQYPVTMTRESYNLYTYNASNADNNGGYVDSHETAYVEPAYYRLEVAKANETLASPTWENAWAACKAKAPVGAWRLPRGTELALMKVNKTELEKTPGFNALESGSYWSGKERSTTKAWQIVFPDMPLQYGDKADVTMTRHVRCVRELGSLPKVGDYYYYNGNYSTELISNWAVEGIIFWIDSTNPKRFKIVGLDEPPAGWDGGTNAEGFLPLGPVLKTGASSLSDGKQNTLTIAKHTRANEFKAVKWCFTKNKTLRFPALSSITTSASNYRWYLPSRDELQHLFCAYWGAAPTTWVTAPSFSVASGYPDDWTKRFTTTPFVGSGYYWSSSELNDSPSTWALSFSNGSTGTTRESSFRVRCVREITL